jgi:hypothetical protein
LQKYTKSTVVAVILPAFAWGFLHTAYPNEPPYIRGLEVGLIGILAGVVMLRWGILATLVWHYTVDACLVGLLLIRSSSAYFRVSGLVIGLLVLVPFGIAVYSRLRRGGFEADDDLLNASLPAELDASAVSEPIELAPMIGEGEETSAPVAGPRGGYAALSSGMMAFLCVCVLAGGLAVWKLKQEKLGDFLRISVNAKEAEARSEELLRKRGVDTASFRNATIFVDVTDGTANEYLREKIGVHALNEIYEHKLPVAFWHVRFFREDAEEYSVVLKPDGTLHSVHHALAENAKGAALSREDAVAKASAFLTSEKKIDLTRWTLVDATSKKQPARVDHTLVWQENRPLDDPNAAGADVNQHAFERMQVQVLGDEVTSYRVFVQIPDEWRRKHDEQPVTRTIMTFLPLLFWVGSGGLVLVTFLLAIKSPAMKEVPWKRLATWSLGAMLAYVLAIAFGDKIAQTMSQAPTSVPYKMVAGGLGIGFFVGAFVYLGALLLLLAIGWFFLREALPEEKLPGWIGMAKEYYRDALLIGLGGAGGLIAFGRLIQWAQAHWPTLHQGLGTSFGTEFDATLPALAIGSAALLRGLFVTGAIAASAGFVMARGKSTTQRVVLFMLASLALVGGWGGPADFARQWVAKAVFLAVVVFGVSRVARLNLLGYFLVLAIPATLLGAVEMLSQPNSFYHQQGMLCLVALGVLLALPVLGWLTTKAPVIVEQAK